MKQCRIIAADLVLSPDEINDTYEDIKGPLHVRGSFWLRKVL